MFKENIIFCFLFALSTIQLVFGVNTIELEDSTMWEIEGDLRIKYGAVPDNT